MKNFILYVFLFFFGYNFLYAQKIKGKIINFTSIIPIENVTIKTDKNTGVYTNNLGEFYLDITNVNSITFSYLGFKTQKLTIKQFKENNYIVLLNEIANQLNEVHLNNMLISLDSLLFKTQKSMEENYFSETVKQNFYVIEKQNMNFNNLKLDLKKSTLLSRKNKKMAQNDLTQFTQKLIKHPPEVKREFYGSNISKKATSVKTTKVFNIAEINTINGYINNKVTENLTINNIEKKVQNIVLKHLNKNKTYKVKTGLFKLEDSLSLKKILKLNDSVKNNNSFNQSSALNFLNIIEQNGVFVTKEEQHNFLNQKYYTHIFEENEFLGANSYYVITFKPKKSKAKFSGKIYINPIDFTIKKTIYSYAKNKRGSHLNLKWLLGIKYSENKKETTLFYEKTPEGKIYTSYYKNEFKNYAYINRPIKLIENSKDKEKVKFNIKIEVTVSEKTEIFLSNTATTAQKFKKTTKKKYKKRKNYLTKKEYEATNWKNLINNYLAKYQ